VQTFWTANAALSPIAAERAFLSKVAAFTK